MTITGLLSSRLQTSEELWTSLMGEEVWQLWAFIRHCSDSFTHIKHYKRKCRFICQAVKTQQSVCYMI